MIKKDRWKKIFSIFLILILTLTNVFTFTEPSYGKTKIKIISGDESIDDLSYFDIWKHEDNTWQNGKTKGSNVTETFTIKESRVPKGAKIVSITGDFDSSYSGEREKHCVPEANVSNIQYEYAVGQVKDSDKAEITYTVDTKLITSKKNDKNTPEDIKKGWQAPNVEGWRYYIPVIFHIEYEIEVEIEDPDDPPEDPNDPPDDPEIGDFKPGLSLPSSAEQFEYYTVADDTMVDSDCTIDYSVLEKHYGDDHWGVVDTWDGTGKPGENTGGSISESCYTTGTVWYKITAYDIEGNEKSIIKTIKIEDEGSVSSKLYVSPYLDLDEYTYEGHPAHGRDESEFEVEKGEETFVYSPSQAYKRRLARNTFRILEDTPHVLKKKSDTLVEVVFEKKGFYNMELEIKPRNKEKVYVSDPIEVRKTPYIIDSLGGFQKENRKQTLSLNIAIHPDHPLTDLFVKIKDKATGEEVYLKPTKAQNSNTIKTRLMTSDKGKYFEKYELEFLTKNNKQKDYEYSVYAHDGKGGVDSATKTFTVYPDLPPEPKIDLLESYLRTQKSNTAQIKAECKTVSKDGDQVQRTWWVASDTNHNGYYWDETYKSIQELGHIDESFGSKQKIKINKNGVGKFNVKLFVKEVWTEPTLEEYVTDADRLTAFTYKASEVINIAPVVSAELMDTTPVDVLLLTPEKDIKAAQSKMTTLDAAFKEKGIDANVNLHAIHDVNPNALGEVFNLSQDSGQRDGSYGRGKRYINMIPEMDNQYLFRVTHAGLKEEGERIYSLAPYTLEAYDILSHAKVWRYTLTDQELIAAMGKDITAKSKSTNLMDIHLDKTEQYVYITSDQYNKTIVLKRDTGSFVTKLNFVVDGDIYVTDQAMFLFKSNCIEKYNLLNNTHTTFMDCGSSSTNFVDGKVHFITVDTNTQLFRGILDLNTQSIKKEYIHTLQDTQAYSSSYIPAGIDIKGNALIVQKEYKDEDDELSDLHMSIIDKDNRIIKEINHHDALKYINMHTTYDSYGLITNEKGDATHFYFTYTNRSSFWNHHYVYEIFGDKKAGYSYHEKYEGSVIFSKHLESEKKIILIKGESFWDRSRAKALEVWTPNYAFYESGHINLSGYTRKAVSSDKFFALIANKNKKDNLKNGQIIIGHRYHQTLIDVMERAVNQYAYFRDDAQKYVVIMEDLYKSDKSKMQDMINKFKNKGIKVIYIGRNAVGNNHYSKIIAQAVQGKTLNYSNVHTNFNNIANTISSLKSRVKHFANLNFRQNDTVRLQKKLTLDPSSEYMYEYDIQYNKDMANKAVDVVSLYHEFRNIPNYGMMDSRQFGSVVSKGYLKDVVFEDFNGTGEHPLLTLDKGERDLRHYPSNGFFGDDVYNTSKDGNLNFRMEEDGFVTFDFNANTYWNKIYLDGKELYKGEHGNIPYILYLSKGEHTLYCRAYNERADRQFTIDNFKIQYIKKNAISNGTHSKQPVKNIKAGKVYHVKNTFTTPSELAEMVNIPGGYKVVEHFNSWAITPYVTHYDSKIENGVLKSANDKWSRFNIKIPENTICKAKIRFDYTTRHKKKHARVEVTHHGSSTSYDERRGTVNYDGILYAGDYDVRVRNGTFEVDKLELQYFSRRVNDWERYFPSKEFTGNSTLNLWINGSKNDAVSLSNFKLYKVIDGNKYLVFESPCINQNTFHNLWHITKSWGTQINFDKKEQPEPADPPLVYKKGELIAYNINYSDYENDPSKREYWQYIHVPFNDGLHPEQGKILNKPIERSWVDGKYMVKHWQEDNTGAAGYDKLSNTEEMVFYIMAEAPVAPEVTYIKTHPSEVRAGHSYKIEIGVHDEDLDRLNTTIEVYKKNQLIYTYIKNNVSPRDGTYPPILSGNAPIAEDGKYTIVATAKDDTGVGMKSYDFTVKEELKIINAALMPNPAMAGDELIFTIKTKGKANKIEIIVPNEISRLDDRGKYNYPLIYNVDGSVETKTNTFKYISNVNMPKTLSPQNKRIRPPYTFIVRAWKGTTYKEIPLTLEVRRSVLDLIKPMVRDIER